MTSEELATAGLPPAEDEIQEAEVTQLPEDDPFAPLADLGVVKRERSNPKQKILKMWTLIYKISLPRNARSLSLRLLSLVNLRLPRT
jgi:hypothetical protein